MTIKLMLCTYNKSYAYHTSTIILNLPCWNIYYFLKIVYIITSRKNMDLEIGRYKFGLNWLDLMKFRLVLCKNVNLLKWFKWPFQYGLLERWNKRKKNKRKRLKKMKEKVLRESNKMFPRSSKHVCTHHTCSGGHVSWPPHLNLKWNMEGRVEKASWLLADARKVNDKILVTLGERWVLSKISTHFWVKK